MRQRLCLLLLFVFAILLGARLLDTPTGSAAPPRQVPNPLVLVSNHGQAGANLDWTWVQRSMADPDPAWRDRDFDASSRGWFPAFPAKRLALWGGIMLVDDQDHIWGGRNVNFSQLEADEVTTGPLYDGRCSTGPGTCGANPAEYAFGYPLALNPQPQYLFVRKEFCIPINADADAQRRLTSGGGSIELQNAVSRGAAGDRPASVGINASPVIGTAPSDETGATTMMTFLPGFLYRGINALLVRTSDARTDDSSAILYRAAIDYALVAVPIVISPPSPVMEGEPVNFTVAHDGLSDRPWLAFGDYLFDWTFGDGGVFSAYAPNATHTYTTQGNYTVDVVIGDRDGCTATATVDVVVQPVQLSITKTVQPNPVNAGDAVRYDVIVRNDSPAAVSVEVTDTLPLELNFASCTDGCTTPGPRTVHWGPLTLNAGEQRTLSVYANVDVNASGTVYNDACIGRAGSVCMDHAQVPLQIIPATPTPTPTESSTPTSTGSPTATSTNTATGETPTATPTQTPSMTPTGTQPTPTETPTVMITRTPGPTSPPPPNTAVPTSIPSTLPTPAFLPVSGQAQVGMGLFSLMAVALLVAGVLMVVRFRR